MKEWKVRQQTYHNFNDLDDLLSSKPHTITTPTETELISDIVEYFTIPVSQLIYPSKSYAVAIIYSKLLGTYFNENFYESLNDPHLLYNNDKYFKPYDSDKPIYDKVLSNIDLDFGSDIPPQVVTTIDYFKKEFYIDSL